MSESEPELGLGTLVQAEGGRVHILFLAAGERRQYASDNAPLRRVRFRAGDRVVSIEGVAIRVESVSEAGGLLFYRGEGLVIPEAQLDDRISFSRPEERLLSARCDDNATFLLRQVCLCHRFCRQQSPTRGFVGGRVALLPHQLYIAQEVSERHAPRVLLSDEAGLGKTIEAGWILHRLLVSGRARRVLIVAPESLVHQWFVELLRKFNLQVSLFDEDRCLAIERAQSGTSCRNPAAATNPFLDDQWILCSAGFLARSSFRLRQAADAGWDMLVVDEAHHLKWSEAAPSPEYQAVDTLAQKTEGLLLLTATPEQLGIESHFARLRLLDPERYPDYPSFLRQSSGWREIAVLAEKLAGGETLSAREKTSLKSLTRRRTVPGDMAARTACLNELLDLHGPGRVIFRNTRNAVRGFPRRIAHLTPIETAKDRGIWLDRVSAEFAADEGAAALGSFLPRAQDPRIQWLAGLVKRLAPRKILLICRSKEKVRAIDDALRQQIHARSGVFHEDLPLIQRDRNAAWFATEDGAQLLLCSEIGSEGRNFQFAHHLVLFDLPLHPDLLAQRIGRLDRIGQTKDIQIHVPYLAQSPQEVASRWHHEGLDNLETNLEGGHNLFERFHRHLHDLALEYPALSKTEAATALAALLEETRTARRLLLQQLQEGRNRLLELGSFRKEPAQTLIEQIQADDADTALEDFMAVVFDRYGVQVEELAARTYRLDPSGVVTDAFPALPKEGLIATFDRRCALSREDIAFLTWDHPIVTGAMDLILSSETGNSCFAIRPNCTDNGFCLQAIFELAAVAPAKWHVDRFLPPSPIPIAIDHQLNPVPLEQIPSPAAPNIADKPAAATSTLQDAPPYPLLDNDKAKNNLLPKMLKTAEALAQKQARQITAASLAKMKTALNREIDRLTALQKINNHIRPVELQLAKTQREQLETAINQATLRLDSVRIIWKTAATA